MQNWDSVYSRTAVLISCTLLHVLRVVEKTYFFVFLLNKKIKKRFLYVFIQSVFDFLREIYMFETLENYIINNIGKSLYNTIIKNIGKLLYN